MRLLKNIDYVMSKKFVWLVALFAFIFSFAPNASASNSHGEGEKPLNVKEIIFEHLGDGYGWEVPFMHAYRIPLPVIVRAEDGQWFCFSSGDLTHVEHGHPQNVVKTIERGGKSYSFVKAEVSSNKNKVVQIFPVEANETAALDKALAEAKVEEGDGEETIVPGFAFVDGSYYREYRPFDISITKNVAALFIAALLVIWVVMALVKFYKRNGFKAPRKGLGFVEMVIQFVYYDTIKATLGDQAKRFAPYLLTCFFFILTMNLVGLIVIFPGGANLTGNIAITLVLAVMTFVVTNVCGTKHYWKEIFWPDCPIWLKCPLPIMQIIEIFGIFTKPAALCVRLFANMMGGHIIVITLTLLIFIFAAFGPAVAGGATLVSVIFSIVMLGLDVLVSFIQAYVFTMLSTIFISMAVVHEEHAHGHEEEAHEEKNLLQEEAAKIDSAH